MQHILLAFEGIVAAFYLRGVRRVQNTIQRDYLGLGGARELCMLCEAQGAHGA